jgi:cbb3-type cytochrome oxidase subunit 3
LPASQSEYLFKDRKKDMPDNASRRGAVDLGMPLMILAFLVIVGFMYWLNVQAQADRASRVIEEEPIEETTSESVGVDLGEAVAIGANMDAFVGETIQGVGYEVASLLGTEGFWVNTASGNPFLVAWSEEMRAAGVTVAQGDIVDVVGELLVMQISYLDEWEAEGGITANDRIIAEFATHFVVAESVEVTGRANEGGNGSGD